MELTHAAAATFITTYSAELGAGLVFGLGTAAAGVAVTAFAGYVLVRMPADYLLEPTTTLPSRREHQTWTRVAARCGRNLIGGVLIATGAVLAVPSIPPGKSLIFVGAMLLDFPGKRHFEGRLLSRAKLLGSANRFRARFGRAPLQIDPARQQRERAIGPVHSTSGALA